MAYTWEKCEKITHSHIFVYIVLLLPIICIKVYIIGSQQIVGCLHPAVCNSELAPSMTCIYSRITGCWKFLSLSDPYQPQHSIEVNKLLRIGCWGCFWICEFVQDPNCYNLKPPFVITTIWVYWCYHQFLTWLALQLHELIYDKISDACTLAYAAIPKPSSLQALQVGRVSIVHHYTIVPLVLIRPLPVQSNTEMGFLWKVYSVTTSSNGLLQYTHYRTGQMYIFYTLPSAVNL